jgi:hypothetical protein
MMGPPTEAPRTASRMVAVEFKKVARGATSVESSLASPLSSPVPPDVTYAPESSSTSSLVSLEPEAFPDGWGASE